MGHLAGWKNCLGTEKVDSKSQKLLRTNRATASNINTFMHCKNALLGFLP